MKKIPFVLFIATLIFAPLAFGTVEEWSMATVQLLIALTVFFFCLFLLPSSGRLHKIPGLIPLVLLIGFMALQIVPLPVFLVKILSPSSYQAYQPVYEMSAGNPWLPLSVYQKATILECIRIAGYGFFYILTIQLLSNGERLKQTVLICSWLAIGIAVLAILQKYSSPDLLYWIRSFPANAKPMGPWVYRSQYCGYIGMLAPLVLALALYYRPVLSSDESLRQRIVSFFSLAGGNLYIVLGFGLLIMVTSAFISLSRGGIIAVTVSLLFFFSVLAWKSTRYSNLLFIGVFGCLILSVTWFGWDPILKRFEDITRSGAVDIGRFPVWLDSLQVIKDFWLTGSGFGTFIAIFPLYRTFPGSAVFDHAHNDYLELLTDGGIIGFALAAWFVWAVIRAGWKMIGQRRDRYARLISIGALAGIIAMLIHSVSDFNMHNGADGLYFFFLCGLLVSAGNTRFYYQMDATLLKRSTWLSREVFLFAGGVFLCAVILVQGGAMLAVWKYDDVRSVYLSRQLSEHKLAEVSSTLEQASRLDPFEGFYPALQGDVQRYMQQPEKALEYYLEAGRRDPLDGAFLQQIGMMLPDDQHQRAELLIEKGVGRSLQKDDLLLARVEWLLKTDQRAKAVEALRGGLEQNPKLIHVALPLLQGFSFTREELAAVLPKSVGIWLQSGAFLEKIDNLEDAAFFREHALDFLDLESKIEAGWFSQLYHVYRKQQEEEKALRVLRLGIEKIPGNAQFHVWLGDYYNKEGITYRAQEEYRQALLLEPGNVAVQKKIEKLGAL
ncbi:MAG: hypothetical protein VR65_22680 [Desulfobulbaceae bacterium BRH_c16a]|nr:MAG: hypothetical protein VR65_22680 [Desulfobulbaceae bacterium BRH_c16a]